MPDSSFSDLSNLKFIALSGEKTATFLQGQLTCDVREITANQTRRAAHCNPKGRVLSTFRIFQRDENFYLSTPSSMCDFVIEQLKKYAVFSKVTLAEDNSLKAIGCVGKQIALTLATLFNKLPEEPDQAVVYHKEDINFICIRVQSDSEAPRFEIIGDLESINWLQELLLKEYPLKTSDFWRLLDIDLGIANIYPETRDLFIPQMLNYPALNAVSFKKGCYTGQEIIARTHYLGKTKRHLHTLRLKSEELLKAGGTIYDENQEAVGVVVDAVFGVEGEWHCLGVLRN